MKIIDKITASIRGAAEYNGDVETAPACILWPDPERQWEPVIPRFQAVIPELFVLGDYVPEKRTGPAVWLRCMIARKLENVTLPNDSTPVIYIPGVGLRDLKAAEHCPEHLKPLVELTYRGTVWCNPKGRDWTLFSYFKTPANGPGLDMADDNDTKKVLPLALFRFLDEDTEELAGKRLGHDYFTRLLSADPARDILTWLDQGDAFQTGLGENFWPGFVEVCQKKYSFHPDSGGKLTAAARLAAGEGPWKQIWERYCDAPRRYPNIPALIRRTSIPDGLFSQNHGWPQWNDKQENDLRRQLMKTMELPYIDAGNHIIELEKKHGTRRNLPWAELGESPLAMAIQWLDNFVRLSSQTLTSGTIDEVMHDYRSKGWQCDWAVLKALSHVETECDVKAVTQVLKSLYLPWLDASARYLQKLVMESQYPGNTAENQEPVEYRPGDSILFVDGLRYDFARELAELLAKKGYIVDSTPKWSPIPTITATGKPAVTPVSHLITGEEISADFEPVAKESGKSLKGGYHLKKLLKEQGWHFLEKSSTGDGKGNAWTEYGNIDHEGHENGWKMAHRYRAFIDEICRRVQRLIEAGWKRVRIVTDHGWLMIPGGLEKIELSPALTENKWGRCAVLKEGSVTRQQIFPWYWNPVRSFALADGAGCFRARMEYAHGGISLQECLTLEITVSGIHPSTLPITFSSVVWKGLRCKVETEGESAGLTLDIRLQPGDASTSIVANTKPLDQLGTASVVVEDEDLEGRTAYIVLTAGNRHLETQTETRIGG